MNPCPCGYLGSPTRACRCSPDQVSRYQGKLSGPLLDRIDLHIEVPSLPATDLLTAPPGESTEAIAARSLAARNFALARQGCANADLQGQAIDAQSRLSDKASALLQKAATQLGWSGRSTHRSLKVARTIADLAGSATIEAAHVAEAVQYRRVLKEH
jgi:magnesium chelatase family protein